MGRLILIKKVDHKDVMYYYAVYEEDSLYKISYYMRLDSYEKKINFYLNTNFENPFCIYDVNKSRFEKEPKKTSILKSSSLIKAIKAIKTNNFPEDISYIA